MAVRIRLARYGRTHRPYYRVVAIDSHRPREGRANETLGTYDPLLADKNISVDIERVHAWIEQGARVNESVASLLRKFGYEVYPSSVLEAREKQKTKRKERWAKRKKKDGSVWAPPSRRALSRHKTRVKQARLAEQQKEQEAKAAAAAEAAPSEETPAETSEG
ncbi:MAG: 30S ribosomal protein S16 [Planctomycetota bacterium]